jgi:hypothetical protein
MDQIFTSEPEKALEEPALSSSVPSAMSMPSTGFEPWNAPDGLYPGSLAEYNMMPGPYGTMVSEGFPWPADDFQVDWQTYAPFLDDIF